MGQSARLREGHGTHCNLNITLRSRAWEHLVPTMLGRKGDLIGGQSLRDAVNDLVSCYKNVGELKTGEGKQDRGTAHFLRSADGPCPAALPGHPSLRAL